MRQYRQPLNPLGPPDPDQPPEGAVLINHQGVRWPHDNQWATQAQYLEWVETTTRQLDEVRDMVDAARVYLQQWPPSEERGEAVISTNRIDLRRNDLRRAWGNATLEDKRRAFFDHVRGTLHPIRQLYNDAIPPLRAMAERNQELVRQRVARELAAEQQRIADRDRERERIEREAAAALALVEQQRRDAAQAQAAQAHANNAEVQAQVNQVQNELAAVLGPAFVAPRVQEAPPVQAPS